jgi:8-hydroxy-5-deazaflavin:NADPH oxidoreductase
VVLAVPWQSIQAATTDLDLKGRIVIDTTNPIIQPGFRTAELNGQASSQVVAELLAGARIVKAFNTLLAAVLSDTSKQAGGSRVVFYSGDDAEAKASVGSLINKLGFAGIDLGSLELGGRLQQFPGGPLPTLNLLKL